MADAHSCRKDAFYGDHQNKNHAIAGTTARCTVNFGTYRMKFTAASRGFHCDSKAFELNNSINHGKITVLNISIYCLYIYYFTHIVCAINSSDRSKCWNCTYYDRYV